MSNKKSYQKPKLVVYGDVKKLTQATKYPQTGDLLYDLACPPGMTCGS